ncbi:Rho termination factor N-terminal domain-containing protein [Ancylothrix sp. C2]|uniref:Rho termination factor N-terminal domain-containing protein n=1 Tax=Ancylothrix sp. D3o TaxID=2953691 RepID=UPI0021BB1DE0|nr:Rho termination factor N-terminal domain-containing protein [Ancylothrix sp. D3o]MCT7950099.1 Rho termination factor N-terminal domain-containing protein [Ancylothrix sp. D3o]
MDFAEGQNALIKRLLPKAINHGQLDTDLIAIRPGFLPEITPERRLAIEKSLQAQGGNLATIIVRRSEAYKDEEYEVVYGEDWCFVAKELGISRLWVWVFDLTDEQAAALREEMQVLLGFSGVDKPAVVDDKPALVVAPAIVEDKPAIVEAPAEVQPVGLESASLKQLIERLENSLSEKLESAVERKFSSFKDELLTALFEEKEKPVIEPKPPIKPAEIKDTGYENMTLTKLKAEAKKLKLKGYSGMNKLQLIELLQQKAAG